MRTGHTTDHIIRLVDVDSGEVAVVVERRCGFRTHRMDTLGGLSVWLALGVALSEGSVNNRCVVTSEGPLSSPPPRHLSS